MFAATTSPSYSPTWVSGQMPVTSPIAQSRSPARSAIVHPDATGVGLDPDGLQADPADPGAPAGGHQQPVTAQFRAVVERQDVVVPVPSRGAGVHPQDAARPRPGAGPRRAPRPGGRLAGEQVVGALDEHGFAAEAAHDLGHLDARPARRRGSAGGAEPPSSRWPRGWSTRRPARAVPGSGARTGPRRSPPRRARRCAATPSTSTAPVPASRPVPRNRSMPCSASQRCWPASE